MMSYFKHVYLEFAGAISLTVKKDAVAPHVECYSQVFKSNIDVNRGAVLVELLTILHMKISSVTLGA
jgi:hypothetical protein